MGIESLLILMVALASGVSQALAARTLVNRLVRGHISRGPLLLLLVLPRIAPVLPIGAALAIAPGLAIAALASAWIGRTSVLLAVLTTGRQQ